MCLEYLGTANEMGGLVPYGRHLSRPFPVDGLTSFGSGLGEVSKGFTAMFQCVGNLFFVRLGTQYGGIDPMTPKTFSISNT